MKKIKININRAPVSKEEIESKRNFEHILAQVRTVSKPFYHSRFFLYSLMAALFACVVLLIVIKSKDQSDGFVQLSEVKEIGSTDSLQTQEFAVNINSDTILKTAKGARIKIPAGALQSKDTLVVLLVKEAYTMEDIVRAGLTTKAGRELLSSGGMFYIQAKDSSNVIIQKTISVEIPTEEVNNSMQLYKGKAAPNTKIDWQQPVALKDTSKEVVSKGAQLFKENCKSCHRLGEDAVGPDLAYIGKRRDFDWIKRFVKNNVIMRAGACVTYYGYDTLYTVKNASFDYAVPQAESAPIDYSNDEYAICIYNAYNKSEMTAFSALNDKDIKALCDYFNDESKRLKLPYPKDELYINFQKCKTYKALISELYIQKNKLKSKRVDKIVDNGPFVSEVNRSMQILQMPSNATVVSSEDRKSYVYPINKQAEYYQIEINTFGWYNIDMLTKNVPGVVASKLFVQVPESFANQFQIYLVVPEAKIYGTGGLLKDKKDVYGFYEDNGHIKLPQGKIAHVYLVGEKNGQLIYAAATFVTDTLNIMSLNPTLISKETFNKKIKELLQIEGMSVKAKDSKNATRIRKIDSDLNALEDKIKEAEKSKPKDCDCGCGDEVEYEYAAH